MAVARNEFQQYREKLVRKIELLELLHAVFKDSNDETRKEKFRTFESKSLQYKINYVDLFDGFRFVKHSDREKKYFTLCQQLYPSYEIRVKFCNIIPDAYRSIANRSAAVKAAAPDFIQSQLDYLGQELQKLDEKHPPVAAVESVESQPEQEDGQWCFLSLQTCKTMVVWFTPVCALSAAGILMYQKSPIVMSWLSIHIPHAALMLVLILGAALLLCALLCALRILCNPGPNSAAVSQAQPRESTSSFWRFFCGCSAVEEEGNLASEGIPPFVPVSTP